MGCLHAVHEPVQVVRRCGITAQEPVRAEHPQITLLDEGVYCIGIQVGFIVTNFVDILPRQ